MLGEDDLVLTGTTTWEPIAADAGATDDGGGGLPVAALVALAAVPVTAAVLVARKAGKRDEQV
jgi:hypothetical protein